MWYKNGVCLKKDTLYVAKFDRDYPCINQSYIVTLLASATFHVSVLTAIEEKPQRFKTRKESRIKSITRILF